MEKAMATRPIPDTLVERALDEFRETGELPEDQRIAARVMDCLLNPRVPPPPMGPEKFRAMLDDLVAELETGDLDAPPAPRRCAREELYYEAVYGEDHERYVARRILAWHADCRVDVTAHDYLAEVELPDYGTSGMHMLGFPERLVRPPHVRQARRLLARYADLRERIDQSNPDWREPIVEAVTAFSERGELPAAGLLRDVVLTDAETQALMDHWVGRGDAELIRALGAATQTTGARRKAAIADAQDLAREGRLRAYWA